MQAIFHAATYIGKTFPQQPIIIDGRTFLRTKQIDGLFALARSLNETPRIIECVCSEEVSRQRLEHDLAQGHHPAKNRTYDLYLAVKEEAEPITAPHLVLDTGATRWTNACGVASRTCERRCDREEASLPRWSP
jgi:hypothetical protein